MSSTQHTAARTGEGGRGKKKGGTTFPFVLRALYPPFTVHLVPLSFLSLSLSLCLLGIASPAPFLPRRSAFTDSPPVMEIVEEEAACCQMDGMEASKGREVTLIRRGL